MRTILLATAALAAFVPACALADPPTPVGELVVTATRLPTRLDLVTGAHVIDQAELEARQTPLVEDVLSTIPGVGVARTGAFGGLAAIRIRGASPDKTLVLIDGVPVGDAADPNGTFDPSQVQTGDLARVEVLSGPQGSLWGSDAIGGVVAFTTREEKGLRGEAEGGSFGTARGTLAAGTAVDAYAISASVTGFRTDGISKAAAGTERDPFSTVTGNLGGRVRLGSAVQLDGRLRYTTSDIATDGFAPPNFLLGDTSDHANSHAWQGFARATLDAFGLTHRLSFSQYELHRRNISSFPSAVQAERQVWRWTAEKGGPADATAFVAGAERMDTSADLSGRPSLDLSTTSVFGVLRHNLTDAVTLTGSLRYDDPDRFKGRTTGRLSGAAQLGGGVSVTISAGQGFKTPTVSQAVCDFCFAPTVPLRPERAEGYDARLGWTSGDGRVVAALTGYRLDVRDQIAFVSGRYINIARTRSKGVEAEADARLSDAVRLKLSYAVTDAVDATTGLKLLRVPERSGAAALFWDEGPWRAAFTVRAESSQADTALNGFSRTTRKGFATADLAGAYRLNDHVSLTGRIENLADERFQEVFGYGEPGRAAYVGVRLRN
ncbi:MAG: TonB-dependent receptor plug domain-containing protein [Phenylobacterium sp.]